MKLLLTALFPLLLLASCSKQSLDSIQSNQALAPTVENMTFSPAYAGASMSIKFTFTMNISTQVTKVTLIRVNGLLRLWYKNDPQTGAVTTYDHMVDGWPTYGQSAFYFFEFILADGSKTVTEPFQVY